MCATTAIMNAPENTGDLVKETLQEMHDIITMEQHRTTGALARVALQDFMNNVHGTKLKATNASLEAKNASLEAKNASLEAANATLRKQLTCSEAKNANLEANIRDTQALLNKTKAELKRANEEEVRSCADLKLLKKELDRCQKTVQVQAPVSEQDMLAIRAMADKDVGKMTSSKGDAATIHSLERNLADAEFRIAGLEKELESRSKEKSLHESTLIRSFELNQMGSDCSLPLPAWTPCPPRRSEEHTRFMVQFQTDLATLERELSAENESLKIAQKRAEAEIAAKRAEAIAATEGCTSLSAEDKSLKIAQKRAEAEIAARRAEADDDRNKWEKARVALEGDLKEADRRLDLTITAINQLAEVASKISTSFPETCEIYFGPDLKLCLRKPGDSPDPLGPLFLERLKCD